MRGADPLFSRDISLRFPVFRLTIIAFAGLSCSHTAKAQHVIDPTQSRAWVPAANADAQRTSASRDADIGTQQSPGVIPRFADPPDPTGRLATYQPGGPTFTQFNAFFQNLGTNGRTCFTCHQPQNGWTVSAASVAQRFKASGGKDPIFRLVDGATCKNDDVSTPQKKREAYKLLIEKGLIRIFMGLPNPREFEITSVVDPYKCTNLTDPANSIGVSVYRRPLPATNLKFLSAVMWDGREPDLEHQAIDATTGHAQAPLPGPTPDQVKQIVAFETGLFTAQEVDNDARGLHALKAKGGPAALSTAPFSIGINDNFGPDFNPNIFDLYSSWQSLPGKDRVSEARKSIARGQAIFNTTQINIKNVAGLPDIPNGFCGTCHDTPDVGDHSVRAPLNIGVADTGPDSPPGMENLDVSGLPVFTLACTQGPLAGTVRVVTDPGRGLLTGKCADIGKLKGPILRGLAGRAPYFHNGSAATLNDVVNFYDQRFGLGLTDQQKEDLVNFLNTL